MSSKDESFCIYIFTCWCPHNGICSPVTCVEMVRKEEVAVSNKSLIKINYKQIVTPVAFLQIPFTGCSGIVSCHIRNKSCMEVNMTNLAMDMNVENIVGVSRMILRLLLRLEMVLLLPITWLESSCKAWFTGIPLPFTQIPNLWP